MKPGGCVARTCAATPTSTNGCVYTAAPFNLSLVMRQITGKGTPRALHGLLSAFGAFVNRLKRALEVCKAILPRLSALYPYLKI